MSGDGVASAPTRRTGRKSRAAQARASITMSNDGAEDVHRRDFLRRTSLLGAAVLGTATPVIAQPVRSWLEGPPVVRSQEEPEVAVIGAGVFGGWTALYLRELGYSTVLVDQWGPGNLWSTSGGETRGIRFAYGEREMYSRWAYRALSLWKEWQRDFGTAAGPIYTRTGRLLMQADEVRPSESTLDRQGIPNEVLPQSEVARRFPQIDSSRIEEALWEPDAGILRCGQACEMVAEAFQVRGGEMVIGRASLGRTEGGRLEDVVLENGERISAQSFVFACGPWLPKVFPDVLDGWIDTPTRHLFFIGTPPDDPSFTARHHPNFSIPGGYGFAALEGDNRGFKVGMGGGEQRDPDAGDRTIPDGRVAELRSLLGRWFPALRGQPLLDTGVHHADYTVDGHFIIDTHPGLENVWFAGGGSGHGYKHGPCIGKYTANRVAGTDIDPEATEHFRLNPRRLGADFPDGAYQPG